ncbi:hypothetical protein MYE70_19615 [Marinobacter alexandrii]|uniref:DUF7352 domain-containing protein n=1 Tax=Marinobacter alexandrii TaxID=2570351 RepID=UPI001FFF9BE6|nr:hypothetical protein [Marinobacter alexandrii]MCK2151281.1 hypothetical protein [Marinobacter alexandrii]
MKTIDKYLIHYGQEPTAIKLMPDFRAVFCEYLVGAKGVYLWVEQSPYTSRKAITRNFRVALPGRAVPESYEYIDSAVDPFGSRAHHVFQLPVQVKGQSRTSQPDFNQSIRAQAGIDAR